MKNNKKYSREEKIKYYTYLMLKHDMAFHRAKERLRQLKSKDWQDWESDLQKDLDSLEIK